MPLGIEKAAWDRAIDHVFMPPQLPQTEDLESETTVPTIVISALKTCQGSSIPEHLLDTAIKTLEAFEAINPHTNGHIDEVVLRHRLKCMKPGDTLAFKIAAQNAAMLISKLDGRLLFECFELSSTNEAVMSTKGRLIRTFPDKGFTISSAKLDEVDCLQMVCFTLAKMSSQGVPEKQKTSKKAGKKHIEPRDTTDPGMVSELFFGVLSADGEASSSPAITKRYRDEVLWDDTLLPWRRSPAWLVIRVVLQLLATRLVEKDSLTVYKCMMLRILCHILQSSQEEQVPMETLYIMGAKIHRRLLKLGDDCSTTKEHVESILKQSCDNLKQKWRTIQDSDGEAHAIDLSVLKSLTFMSDSCVKLEPLDSYLKSIADRASDFHGRSFNPTSNLIKILPGQLPDLRFASDVSSAEMIANLHEFESWVTLHFHRWAQQTPCEEVTIRVHQIAKTYHSHTSSYYKKIPEAQSIMLMTLFSLWTAADRAAVDHCSLLRQYDPGVPGHVLENLLLRDIVHMQQLSEIEKCLRDRRATLPSKELFDVNSSNAFATRFVNDSAPHQALLKQIHEDGQRLFDQKAAELDRKQNEYKQLNDLANAEEHEFYTNVLDRWCDPPETEEVHRSSCKKCAYEQKRNNIHINAIEWPITQRGYVAEAIAFELRLPEWYASWRDFRAFMLQTILQGQNVKPSLRARYELSSDRQLSKYRRPVSTQTIMISENKPLAVTHFKSKAIISMTKDDVCVANGLDYRYFDPAGTDLSMQLLFPLKVAISCTYELSQPGLSEFILRPSSKPDGPAPNSVIASQDVAPEHMSLEEYKDVLSIPLGHRLSWLNTDVQLEAPTINLRSTDTIFIVLQCIYQTGPSDSSICRSSHNIMLEDIHANRIIDSVRLAMTRVQANWESAPAFCLFAAIVSRVISLKASHQESCLALLVEMRQITENWVHLLSDKSDRAENDVDRKFFASQAVSVALICLATMDVEGSGLPNLLSESDAVATMVQMSIIIHEGHQSGALQDNLGRFLHWRATRLLYRSQELIAGCPTGLDKAITATWAAFQPAQSGWSKVDGTNGTWLVSMSEAHPSSPSLARTAHLNILNGQFLVNGLPLDQPPALYQRHPLFRTLFGQAALKVMPGTIPGFPFSAKKTIHGFTVHIGLVGGELIVQAHKDDVVFENVPKQVLQDYYPTHFREHFVHWYSVKSKAIVFQPVDDPWHIGQHSTWTLSRHSAETDTWRMEKDGDSLLSMRTKTAKTISRILNPLVNLTKVHITFLPQQHEIRINLPSLRLDFSLSEGSTDLKSKDHAGMSIDANQSLGSLVGLESKLVLINCAGERKFLVPHASVTYFRTSEHMIVRISKDEDPVIHAFTMKPDLQDIADTGGLSSKLFLLYLHALTSSCLPDQFTGCTGTEKSLEILQSAALRSYEQLTEADLNLLTKIRALSPRRSFYPSHLQSMQTVAWSSNLLAMSQHGAFEASVQSLIDRYEDSAMFCPDQKLTFDKASEYHKFLSERDSLRCAAFRISKAGAEAAGSTQDRAYSSRAVSSNARSQRPALIASMVGHNSANRVFAGPDNGVLWALLEQHQTTGFAANTRLDTSRLSYDAIALQPDELKVFLTVSILPLLKFLSTKGPERKYSITMYLATLAYAAEPAIALIQVLALVLHSGRSILPTAFPEVGKFMTSGGLVASRQAVTSIINGCTKPMASCPENQIARNRNETRRQFESRRDQSWKSQRGNKIADFVRAIMNQCPVVRPTAPEDDSIGTYINVDTAMGQLHNKFQIWHENLLVSRYLSEVEDRVRHIAERAHFVLECELGATAIHDSRAGFIKLEMLFLGKAPELVATAPQLVTSTSAGSSRPVSTSRGALLSVLAKHDSKPGLKKHEKAYSDDLRDSHTALLNNEEQTTTMASVSLEFVQVYLSAAEAHVKACKNQLDESAKSDSSVREACHLGFGPRLTARTYLRQLNRHRWNTLSCEWQKGLVTYVLALIAVQRARRLLVAHISGASATLDAELANAGHTNWDPMEYPERLLMEVENNIVIREIQACVAQQMMNPTSGTNAVVQLNMGEGKSSTILPAVACEIATNDQLPICLVLKPQRSQMAQMLRSKLSGLIDRPIRFMPFSRSLRLDKTEALQILELLRQCKQDGGVLLLQPEHLLSFQLMAPEQHLDGNSEAGQALSDVQDYLDQWSRYVVDECDETFSTKFELVYSMGKQNLVDCGSERWITIQSVLDLVRRIAPEVAKELPGALEIKHSRPGSFPQTRILRADAADELVHCIAKDICDSGFRSLPLCRQSTTVKDAVYIYITTKKLDQAQIDVVEKSSFWTDSTRNTLMLLRGILAGGMLAFALGSKRWRVQYGPAIRARPTRLAVPYAAKDCPTPRSEFSHPDVVILLTCLSFYYEGLSYTDMITALKHLMMCDDRDAEYAAWTKDAHNLPTELKQLEGVNIKDRPQCEGVFQPCITKSKGAIDYFLSKIVFPKECREFVSKISSSGWDIAKVKNGKTTGFSGTNDTRHVLPLMMHHQTLPETAHTSARVLEYILQSENRVYLMSTQGMTNDAESLLDTVNQLKPQCQVILDVGAAIIEMTNLDFAKRWLGSVPSKEAIVFVNEKDEVSVLDRTGRIELLQSSPFASRLDAALVFLDEAHTRGIDLKLPLNYRAAVTLGAGLTKDRLLQACMRMRQLGKGQSITLCVPEEIQHKIQHATESQEVNLGSIVLWVMEESLAEIVRNIPLWAAQGRRFYSQQQIWQHALEGGQTKLSMKLAEQFLEDEAMTIEQRYRPSATSSQLLNELDSSSDVNLQQIAAHCREFDNVQFDATCLQEEQERELANEVEQEREVQRPPAATPLPHSLHQRVSQFAETGNLDQQHPEFDEAFVPAFESLSNISAAVNFDVTQLCRNTQLFVTKDFANTIKIPNRSFSDSYNRSVAWILVSYNHDDTAQNLVIVSPYEANHLIQSVRKSTVTSLHPFKARVNSGYRSFDDLSFCTISARTRPVELQRSVAVQLALFAGQLYLSSYEDYVELCNFLGLSTGSANENVEQVDADGFILADAQGRRGGASGLHQSPIAFLQVFVSNIRRHGDSIARTHIGRILAGEALNRRDFELNSY